MQMEAQTLAHGHSDLRPQGSRRPLAGWLAHSVPRLLSVRGWLQRASRIGVLTGRSRRLRVAETVSLGEKCFLSIVEVDGQAFLIGGGTQSVALLASLRPQGAPATFAEVLQEGMHGEAR